MRIALAAKVAQGEISLQCA
jgi:hypothetical protein